MKNLFVALALLGASQFASAAPIFCGSKDTKWRVLVSNDHKTAKVEFDGKVQEFGKLECRHVRPVAGDELVKAFMTCSSKHVADAGYTAVISRYPQNKFKVKLSEITFAGEKEIETIPCVAAQN